MAHIHQHTIVSLIIASFISWHYDYWLGILFFAGGVLIDSDHVLWYMIKFKVFTINVFKIIRDAYTYHIKTDFRNFNVINLFHTAEMWLLLLIASIYNRWILFFSLGLLLHMVMDFGYAYHHNAHHEASRCHSLIRKYFLLKKSGKKVILYNMLT
ncbi:hypothetical protein HYY69_03850 [Candidatus Woesearchaeota archaeon]|nr:hypothetical protein [Candidatus Woesearchaeota archaeon]